MTVFDFEIVTPDSSHPACKLQSLNVPAQEGRMTVLGGHQPYICTVVPGIIHLKRENGDEEQWTVGPGTLKIGRQMVTLLTRHVAR